ncbi:MAG: C40 family peptidase [Gammaproteobacteria bacterium]|nr:C40 family peptidase [Gammaproteobacteria bacterium]
MLIRFFRILPWLFPLIVFSGCSHAPAVNSAPALGSQAVDQALAMVGKPYRHGGNTSKGFDCSGLVQYSYGRVGVQLPHGTRNLLRVSRPISRDSLQRGDLVFFTQEGKKSSHVALYLGNDRFVHSPSSGKNVYVTGFNDPYWQRHFTEARRLEID